MNFPYGEIVSVPEGLVPPECWSEYGAIADVLPICKRETVGDRPRGIRWSVWPLTFEEYVGDLEPDLARSRQGTLARNRLVQWKRVARTDIPPGWHPLSKKVWRVDGYYPLQAAPDYHAAWQKNARHDLRQWQERELRGEYRIEEVSFGEYAAGYHASLIAKRVNLDRLHMLERKLALPEIAKNTALFGVRSRASGALIGGSAVIYSPTFNSSTHFAPFITEEGAEARAATALMNHWLAQALARGERYTITTTFWYPGQPKSWRGFSEFKSHFGWRYVAYPPVLVRFVRGKFF